MRRELAGSMAFDAGTILELVHSTPAGTKVKEALRTQTLNANVCDLTLAETMYVLCRELGQAESHSRMANLLDSGYTTVHPDADLVEAAAGYKCGRAISLADCFALALARQIGVPALFARKERELLRAMAKRPFDVEILFLEDL